MGKIEDELQILERKMDNLLRDLEKLIPYFETKTITDIYVYKEGDVYVKDFEKGTYHTEIKLSKADRLRIINSLASVSNTPIDKWENPTLESIIPKYNIRTTAIVDPWLLNPEITFRRPADKIFSLEEYVEQDRLPREYYNVIVDHIKNDKNIVISGATGSGKTTFANACIEKMFAFNSEPDDRFYIVEDTPELQCKSPYATQIYIRKEQAVKAIQTSLRWTPKKIIFGELRSGVVAVELLEAWNTGHPGNLTTIHADSAASTISRIQGLLRQVIKGSLPDLGETIHLIVHLNNKRVKEVMTVKEIQEGKNMR